MIPNPKASARSDPSVAELDLPVEGLVFSVEPPVPPDDAEADPARSTPAVEAAGVGAGGASFIEKVDWERNEIYLFLIWKLIRSGEILADHLMLSRNTLITTRVTINKIPHNRWFSGVQMGRRKYIRV